MFARQRRVAHPVSVTHTCMNESLELSLLCSVHTATVVYIGTYRTLCIHLQPVQQRGHHKQAIASLAALVLGRPQVLVSVGHGRDNRHSCYFCMCECQGDRSVKATQCTHIIFTQRPTLYVFA